MTNEEAVRIIMGVMNRYHIDSMTNRKIDEALSKSIFALKAEPKHGRWKVLASGNDAICTNCEHYWIPNGDQYDYHYYPYCGAKMEM